MSFSRLIRPNGLVLPLNLYSPMIAKNNPFNLRVGTKWLGLTGSRKGFCEFSSTEYGIRAAAYLLMRTYRKRGLKTIESIINTYAPPAENDTRRYIDFVQSYSGIDKSRELRYVYEYVIILRAIALMENSIPLSAYYLSNIIDKYKIVPYEKEH